MVVEVKWNKKQYQKAKKQIFDGLQRVEEILAGLGLKSTHFQFVGVFFALNGNEFECDHCSIFSIIGERSIQPKMKIIEKRVIEKHENWIPQEHVNEFVDLTREILFVAQGDPHAPVIGEHIINKTVKHVERAGTLDNIILWTSEQLALIQENPENLPLVFFDAFYSTGKSSVCKYYGKSNLQRLEGKLKLFGNNDSFWKIYKRFL